VVEQFRVPAREGSPQTTWNLGKTNAAVSVCSFLGDPAGAGLVPKPRPICLSAAQAVGARIMPRAPPPPGRLGRLPHATGVKENQRDGIPDGSWNPKRWVKVTKRRTGVPLADLHSAPAGGCRKWTLTALAARQLDWHGAWKEARGNFPAFPPGVRGPCAVPASRRCQRRVIGWPPSFCWAKAAGSRRATCLFTPLSRQKGREKTLSFATCFLAVVRRRASVASNQAFAKTGDRRLQAMAESQT
jgi:hypothetical protein